MLNATVSATARSVSALTYRLACTTCPPGCRPYYTEPNSRNGFTQSEFIVRDDSGAKRIRTHGNKALPLPPVLDNVIVEIKTRHKAPKPLLNNDGMNESQKQFAENVYAQALATPIRRCSLTSARLPTHFLQPFSLVFDHVPSKLTPGKPSPPKARFVPEAPSPTITQPSVPQTMYAVSHHKVIAYLNARSNWTTLAGPHITEHFARITGVGLKRIKLGRRCSFGDCSPEEIEKVLVRDAQTAVLKARRNRRLISYDEAMTRLDEIVAFVRFDSDSKKVEPLHDRLCYCLNDASVVQDAKQEHSRAMSTGIFGLLHGLHMVKTLLALDRAFAYRSYTETGTTPGQVDGTATDVSETDTGEGIIQA